MHKWIFILICFSFSSKLLADFPPPVKAEDSQDVVLKMNQLITASEESLKRLKDLKEVLLKYKAAEKVAINNPDNTDNLQKLVQLAKEMQTGIDENYLQDYFPAQFL